MPVKRSNSAARVLTVVETIAAHQPVGVRALARILVDDKSAIQRTLMTLADKGWIRATRDAQVRWELTAHILAIAHRARGSNDLQQRTRPALERLRDETGETVMLVVPDVDNFVVADVVESRQMLRMVTHVGDSVGADQTATGRALLPFLDAAKQAALLGRQPDSQLLALFARVLQAGYAVSDGEVNPDATSIASAITEVDGRALGALVVIGPRQRLTRFHQQRIGELIARVAVELSNGART